MEIWIKNSGCRPFRLATNSRSNVEWSYKEQKITDRFQPREGEIVVPSSIPAQQFAEVIMIDGGRVVFRGYIENYSIDNNRKKTLTIAGVERLLMYSTMPDNFYPEGTAFTELFSHTATVAKPAGLLTIANGMLAPGWEFAFKDDDDNEVLLGGMGTNSRFGTKELYYIGYKYLMSLAPVHDVGELAYIDATYYRNSANLWVRIDHLPSRGWYDRGGLIVDGAFDTTVRLGEVPDDAELMGDLRTQAGDDNVADLITNICRAHDYHVHFRDTVKYLYFDIDEDEGRS